MYEAKSLCEKCYEKTYGSLPKMIGVPIYKLSKDKWFCSMCGKKKHIVLYNERGIGDVLIFK